MNLTAEQQQELAAFPIALRELIEAELAAGNTVVEISHSHPAPPVGACFILANQVSTRPRATGHGLTFYERNSSSYSGEFTDEKRFYFILEPPNSPPSYPDMDAIRTALSSAPDTVTRHIQPQENHPPEQIAYKSNRQRSYIPSLQSPNATRCGLTVLETATEVTRLLHFRDSRPPHEIQFALEGDLMVLFTNTGDDDHWSVTADSSVSGALHHLKLCLEATLTTENCYSLSVGTSWARDDESHQDYYRKTAGSWFQLWTRDFNGANPPAADAGSAADYKMQYEAALQSEAHLDSIPSVQQAIVAAMKQGARFIRSSKEGDTTLRWQNGNFVLSSTGVYPETRVFQSEAEFLIALRQYYDFETSRGTYPNKPSDFDAWKLILRQL